MKSTPYNFTQKRVLQGGRHSKTKRMSSYCANASFTEKNICVKKERKSAHSIPGLFGALLNSSLQPTGRILETSTFTLRCGELVKDFRVAPSRHTGFAFYRGKGKGRELPCLSLAPSLMVSHEDLEAVSAPEEEEGGIWFYSYREIKYASYITQLVSGRVRLKSTSVLLQNPL